MQTRKKDNKPKKVEPTPEVKKEATPLLIHSLMRIKASQEAIAYRKSFCTIL